MQDNILVYCYRRLSDIHERFNEYFVFVFKLNLKKRHVYFN